MAKATLSKDEKFWQAQTIAKAMQQDKALILVSVVTTSASNLSYTYRVVAVMPSNSVRPVPTKWNLNYWLAAEMGESLNKADNLRGNGCGFDRGFDAVYTIGKILEAHGLTDDGHKWASDANWGWF